MATREKAFEPTEHLIKLRGGKEYLPVQWRLVWLRDKHLDANINTELIEHDLANGFALFRSTIIIPGGGSATGYGSEAIKDFGDYIEKAETKATGRALAALGFGTQFCGDDLDEGERIMDAPVDRRPPAAKPASNGGGGVLMNLQRDDRCKGCGQPIAAGTRAFYGRENGAVWHDNETCIDLLVKPSEAPVRQLDSSGAGLEPEPVDMEQ